MQFDDEMDGPRRYEESMDKSEFHRRRGRWLGDLLFVAIVILIAGVAYFLGRTAG